MSIKCDEYGQVCVIALEGDFVGADTLEAQQAVEERSGAGHFVIDFERTEFISSQGLEALLAIRRRCEHRGGRVALAGLDPNCQKILELTRLDRRFECHPDVAKAMKMVM